MTPDGQAILSELRTGLVRAGWSATGRRSGYDRTALHRAFPEQPNGHWPHFSTVCRVAEALGFRIVLVPQEQVQQQKPVE